MSSCVNLGCQHSLMWLQELATGICMAAGYGDGSQGQIGTQAAMGACAVSRHLCSCMICLQVQMWHRGVCDKIWGQQCAASEVSSKCAQQGRSVARARTDPQCMSSCGGPSHQCARMWLQKLTVHVCQWKPVIEVKAGSMEVHGCSGQLCVHTWVQVSVRSWPGSGSTRSCGALVVGVHMCGCRVQL